MKRRLEQFYEAFGDRGIMFILYAFMVVVNSLLTWNMQLPAIFPEEISVAGAAAFYAGKDWSALLTHITSAGFIQAVFYAPLFPVLKNPFVIYKAMLIINAVLISFIPLIIYHIAAKLGVVRVRHKLLAAVCCGMYVSYVVDSKFIWDETITSLLCWLLVLCFFSAWDKRTRSAGLSSSVLMGFLCALSYAANERLLALSAAIIITILLARFLFREKIVNLTVFAASAALSYTGEHFLRIAVQKQIWGAADGGFLKNVSWGDFFGALFSQIYAFMTSTLGIGAAASALCVIMLYNCVKEGIRRRVDSPESGTRVYEPVKHKYSLRLTIFAMFQFIAVLCTTVYSALRYASGQETASDFGRYGDNLAPLALFVFIVFIVLYGIDMKHILLSVGIYAYSCLCFGLVGYPMISSAATGETTTSVMGLVPVPLGNGDIGDIGGMAYIILSSCTFTIFSLIMVFISCSRRHRKELISAAVLSLTALSFVYSGFFYIPEFEAQALEQSASYREVSALLYNDRQSPPIIVYDSDIKLSAAIQFLNPETTVAPLEKSGRIPESCLLIAANEVKVPLEGGSYDNVGKTDTYSVYAFGEAAREFINYNLSNYS